VSWSVVDDPNSNTIKVLQFIQQNPGSHLRKIKKEIDLSMGTIQYHLNLLEKNGKIVSERHNLHRHYFPVGMFDNNEKNVLKILGQVTAREILMFIIEKNDPTQTDIVEHTQLSAPSVNWQIKRLVEFGLINSMTDGKYKRYKIIGDSNFVIKLMKSYHPAIWDVWTERLAETFLAMQKEQNANDSK
jgi:predicted transcriptional regulator